MPAMDRNGLIAHVCEALVTYTGLGGERFEADGANFLRNRATPRRFPANQTTLVRAEAPAEIEALMARFDAEYEGFGHRQINVDPGTPAPFVAHLALDGGFKVSEGLHLLLEGGLRATPAPVEIREVLEETDWLAYRELDAMWWRESSVPYFGPYDEGLHDELMAVKRNKGPSERVWLACLDGEPRGFFSSWPGETGVGIVEDLFVHPEFRRRGLATALLAHCVSDARSRGAGPVLISADPNDTPKRIYAAMGFRPLFVTRTYLRRLEAQG